jgi:uncharacterized protein involved in exopolysaccharide biosynthesis
MTYQALEDDDRMSLLAVGTILLHDRWRIARWALLGIVAGLAVAATRQPIFSATASFIPKGNDPSRSGLQSLAGQFGVSLPAGTQSLSPDFYAHLVKSRDVLGGIAYDTLVVSEMGGNRVPVEKLFGNGSAPSALSHERAIRKLDGIIQASWNKTTGVVESSVVTRWPSVSLAILQRALDGVNDFNQRMSQTQAGAERKFLEAQLRIAGDDLRVAEDAMQSFLQTNRSFSSASELEFHRERLQREVTLRQGLFTSLQQGYQDARIRELRDMPVVTLVDRPSLPVVPQPMHRLTFVLVGAAAGLGMGTILVLLSAALVQERAREANAVAAFESTWRETKLDLRNPRRWMAGLARR